MAEESSAMNIRMKVTSFVDISLDECNIKRYSKNCDFPVVFLTIGFRNKHGKWYRTDRCECEANEKYRISRFGSSHTYV